MEGKWKPTAFSRNHASDRTVQDALLELYMNAVDAQQAFDKKNGQPPRMPSINIQPDAVVIENDAVRGIDEADMWVGPPDDAKDKSEKMGRHSMGLKDAIAVMYAEEKEGVFHGQGDVEITAFGQVVKFSARDRGLMHYQISNAEAKNARWCVKISGLANAKQVVKAVKSHFVQYCDQKLDLLHEHVTKNGVKIIIYAPNHFAKKKTPSFLGPGSKAGLFVGPRFVPFPDNSQVTLLGYHIQNPTPNIKLLINRNQEISNLKSTPILWNMILEVFHNNAALVAKVKKFHAPNGFMREINNLPDFQRPVVQASERFVGGGGAKETKAATQAIGTQEAQPVTLHVKAVKNAVKEVRDSIQRQWKENGVQLLNKLNGIAMDTFSDLSAQVVPYGSMIYEVRQTHTLWVLCVVLTHLANMPMSHCHRLAPSDRTWM